ncbi:MAG: Rrf2 family transcriptional regulator [Bacteroidales bacterium]|jgi:Rrf2 family protein|nr:Rrf2 family transcriptional regulator [Bacteroidales bacterium]
MTKFIAFSEADAIAFHGMALIAKSETAINAVDISEAIGASKHHASKVLQKLVKNGILGSTRGPSGGFYLARPADEIKIIEILQAIEGEVSLSNCPIDNAFCPFGNCLMGGICHEVSEKLVDHLKTHTLQDMINNIPPDRKLF